MSDKNFFEENSHLLLFHPSQQSSGQAQEDMQGQRKTGRLVLLKAGMIMFLLKMFLSCTYLFSIGQCHWFVAWSLYEGPLQLCEAPCVESKLLSRKRKIGVKIKKLALEVNCLLFSTPRKILSSDGKKTSPAQLRRQWAAVRKMLLPIWEERNKLRKEISSTAK